MAMTLFLRNSCNSSKVGIALNWIARNACYVSYTRCAWYVWNAGIPGISGMHSIPDMPPVSGMPGISGMTDMP